MKRKFQTSRKNDERPENAVMAIGLQPVNYNQVNLYSMEFDEVVPENDDEDKNVPQEVVDDEYEHLAIERIYSACPKKKQKMNQVEQPKTSRKDSFLSTRKRLYRSGQLQDTKMLMRTRIVEIPMELRLG